MSGGGAGGAAGAAGGAAAAAAAIANAIKASGTIVRVEAQAFASLLSRQEKPLVVHAMGGFFGSTHKYLCSYRGLAFFAESRERLRLPLDAEIIEAKSIWIPR
jgi:hypothetical protein